MAKGRGTSWPRSRTLSRRVTACRQHGRLGDRARGNGRRIRRQHRPPWVLPLRALQHVASRLPPPQDFPLAVCDARTVAPEDEVTVTAITVEKDTGEITHDTTGYLYNPAHRWYYYRDMTPAEVLVFKAHDTGQQPVRPCAPQRVHRSIVPRRRADAGKRGNARSRPLCLAQRTCPTGSDQAAASAGLNKNADADCACDRSGGMMATNADHELIFRNVTVIDGSGGAKRAGRRCRGRRADFPRR